MRGLFNNHHVMGCEIQQRSTYITKIQQYTHPSLATSSAFSIDWVADFIVAIRIVDQEVLTSVFK